MSSSSEFNLLHETRIDCCSMMRSSYDLPIYDSLFLVLLQKQGWCHTLFWNWFIINSRSMRRQYIVNTLTRKGQSPQPKLLHKSLWWDWLIRSTLVGYREWQWRSPSPEDSSSNYSLRLSIKDSMTNWTCCTLHYKFWIPLKDMSAAFKTLVKLRSLRNLLKNGVTSGIRHNIRV